MKKFSSIFLVTTVIVAAFGVISPNALTAPSVPSCFGKRPRIVGTAGNDYLQGTSGPDVIAGLGGRDQILGGGGNDRICGGVENDILWGGNADGQGGDGNDQIAGQPGDDTLHGEGGDDTLTGYTGNDAFWERFEYAPANDTMSGGPGFDGVQYTTSAGPIQASLQTGKVTGDGTDTLNGFEQIDGSLFDDILTGDGGAENHLSGLAGNDIINGGGGGYDHINGGYGDDNLNSQDGNTGDYLEGAEHVEGDTCTIDPGEAVHSCEFIVN